jgi:hypothetical protein
VFEKIFKLQEHHSAVIEDFSINEISLEDIFLQIREQLKEVRDAQLQGNYISEM